MMTEALRTSAPDEGFNFGSGCARKVCTGNIYTFDRNRDVESGRGDDGFRRQTVSRLRIALDVQVAKF